MRVFLLEDDSTRIREFRRAFIGTELHVAVDMSDVPDTFKPPYDILCLDHDLGGRQMVDGRDQNTGTEFCRRLPMRTESDFDPLIVIHSFNMTAAMGMYHMLHDKGYTNVLYYPFATSLMDKLQETVEKNR